MKKNLNLMPLNLQFFAEAGEGEGSQGGEGEANQGQNDQGGGAGTGDQNQQQNTGSKTFTQEEVNTIGAREKSQGKSSILKLFGCADEKSAKERAEAFKKWEEAQKTDEQKKNEADQKLRDTANENEKRAIAAENKLAAISAGVTTESVDDALAIALLKVTEEKSLEKVFEEMKKEQKYSGFFGKSSSQGGTGSSADHSSGSGGTGNIGERLGKSRVAKASPKSNFFTN